MSIQFNCQRFFGKESDGARRRFQEMHETILTGDFVNMVSRFVTLPKRFIEQITTSLQTPFKIFKFDHVCAIEPIR